MERNEYRENVNELIESMIQQMGGFSQADVSLRTHTLFSMTQGISEQLPADTRFRAVKRMLLKVMRVYSRLQQQFNRQLASLLLEVSTTVDELQTYSQQLKIEVEALRSRIECMEQDRATPPEKDPTVFLRGIDMGQDYLDFEQVNRGEGREIESKQKVYLDLIKSNARTFRPTVLDLGCGRGEWLRLVRNAGWTGLGVDSDPAMVDACVAQELDAKQADIFEFLVSPVSPPDVITAFQLLEHLAPREVMRLCQLAYEQLSPGGMLIVETINPASFFGMINFWRDISHVRPYPLETMEWILRQTGFRQIESGQLNPITFSEEVREPYGALVGQDYMVWGIRP